MTFLCLLSTCTLLMSTAMSTPTTTAQLQPMADQVFTFPEGQHPQPFTLKVDEAFLNMTMRKVRDFRPARGLSDEWDMEGPPAAVMSDLAAYWANRYDWKDVQEQMNDRFHHYATTVPGSFGEYSADIPLHFVHERSSNPEAVPLLLLHGWPSTFLEWSKVIVPLSKQRNADGESFHIVAPDLPGFGFSPAPTQPGLGPRELSHALDALMHQLGYDKYGIVTTDLGWFTGMWMVSEVEDSIIGHMTDFFIGQATSEDRARIASGEASDEVAEYVAASDEWFTKHWVYATAHAQKPLALAHALNDSPLGFLAWYMDINHATSDGYQYSHDQLITDAMMLLIPGPYNNIRAYLEFFKPYVMNFPSSKVPTGVSEWGWGAGPFKSIANFAFVPEEMIKRSSNLVYFKKHASGGHFPAVMHPKPWMEDVREFFQSL